MIIHTLPLGDYQTNCYIAYAPESKTCAVIDPGYFPERILAFLADKGLSVDAILLTGGFAYDKVLMGWIEEYVGFLAPVHVYPGEDEMLALAQGAMRVLTGKETAKVY